MKFLTGVRWWIALPLVGLFLLSVVGDWVSTFWGVLLYGFGLELNPLLQSWPAFALGFLVNVGVAGVFLWLLRRGQHPTLQFFLIYSIVHLIVLRGFVIVHNVRTVLAEPSVVVSVIEATPAESKPWLYFLAVVWPTLLNTVVAVGGFVLWKLNYYIRPRSV
jgi:hypothetical protein